MRIAYIAIATLSMSMTLIAANPLLGTWKLNVAKSKVQCSGNIASETMKITEPSPNSFQATFDIVPKSGEPNHSQSPTRFLDGKEHAAPGRAGVSEIVQQVDASTIKVTLKKDGKVTGELTIVVASDGNVHTVHRVTGTCDETLFFEKQ